MSHLMESTRRMAENDPTIEKHVVIPTGTMVLYHGRVGAMRQGRTAFPAMVLKQHPDDGSLDLIVFFEAEDWVWEQRIRPYTVNEPGHCYELIEIVLGPDHPVMKAIEVVKALVRELKYQMYGEYTAPEKSMIEYLDDFDKRLKVVEKFMRT